MSDLVEFILARLDEDEQTLSALDSVALNGIESTAGEAVREYVEHGMRDIAAKRRILDEHAIEYPGEEWQYCRVCEDRRAHDAASAPCATLKLLALPYSSHPDYREEWRPE